ncbi:MAG: hypothetical protein AVDCRST_MAG59-3011 [uncultured Thermomicrobiales bacterium]|uniref:Uncharacterized protein n=1 Tax=uncultured Thermomicrobiales bacterium TaxID=1645740 RepID=A0A6J4V0N6_9BACT|nr:MAG: hypothetical protein AVDCRST_MAG59-3011 [uncultured Thermomicrobiales bacterium]
MVGTSFDRLAVAVDCIRGKATRRGALATSSGVIAPPATGAAPRSCTSPGFECRRDGDCCSGRCTRNICAYNGAGSCQNIGFGCRRNSDCCSDRCDNNRCVSGSGGGSGQSNGFGCFNDRDCCNGRCERNICVSGGGGGGGGCPSGFSSCGGAAGPGCCPVNTRCCRGGFSSGCCPSDHRCRSNGQCALRRTSRGTRDGGDERTTPRIERVPSRGDWERRDAAGRNR